MIEIHWSVLAALLFWSMVIGGLTVNLYWIWRVKRILERFRGDR